MPFEFVKPLARLILGDYAAYYIYTRSSTDPAHRPPLNPELRVAPIDEASIESSSDALIRDQLFYCGSGAQAYGCYAGERIVGACFYWYGNRYLERNFWPLQPDEAKLVQIVALPDMRGRGVATVLIAISCEDMLQRGFRRLYARIWHSNVPSWRAFTRAGWQRIALVVEVNPFRFKHPHRLRWRLSRPLDEET